MSLNADSLQLREYKPVTYQVFYQCLEVGTDIWHTPVMVVALSTYYHSILFSSVLVSNCGYHANSLWNILQVIKKH